MPYAETEINENGRPEWQKEKRKTENVGNIVQEEGEKDSQGYKIIEGKLHSDCNVTCVIKR